MKLIKSSFFLRLTVLAALGSPAFSQTTDSIPLTTIISKTGKFATNYPQEKVHLHLDKPYYAVGDTIWFKAYLTDQMHVPSAISKIVYIDVSYQDTLITSLKLPVSGGLSWGNIALDAQMFRQGGYQIRAYTRWMMNFDAAYFFTRNINIANAQKPISTHFSLSQTSANSNATITYKSSTGVPYILKKVSWELNGMDDQPLKGKGATDNAGIIRISLPNNKLTAAGSNLLTTFVEIDSKSVAASSFPISLPSKLDIQFFPEGGDIISDLPGKVAFKAIKSNGMGVDVKGNITDNTGKVISEFSSQHLGMGSFVLVPEGDKTYTANIAYPAAFQGAYPLPPVKAVGIKLTVNNALAAANISARILCSTESLKLNAGKTFYIIAKVGETVCYAAQMSLQNQVQLISIPKDKFPTGIAQITVFASNGQALSERIVFVQNPDGLNLTLKTDKPVYSRRQKVRLAITAKNGALPAEANLSVAVTDETKVPFDEGADVSILSSLLLTSALKGNIEKPNYYFSRQTEKTAADLDLLMLTQGYSRFTYKDILADKLPKIIFMPEQGIEITGTLRNSTGMPVFKGNVRLKIPDKSYTAFATTNSYGLFKFQNLLIPDSTEVIVTSADYMLKNPMLTIDPTAYYPPMGKTNPAIEHVNIDSALSQYVENNKRIIAGSRVLKEVTVIGKKPSNAPSHADYPSLAGLSAWPDHLIPKDRLTNCPFFLSCLQSNSMGIIYANENFYVNRDYNAGNKTPMQIFYNGMPVDPNYLNSIASADVESVEIFLKDELGLVNRSYNSNGVIVINGKKVEKKPKMSMEEIQKLLPKPGEIKFMPQGYAVAREFYSPKYIAPQATAIGNDLRTTIYWNPKIRTDKATGATFVEFYNADGRGNYKVVAEGLDAEGHIGRFVYRYKVE